MGYGRKEVQLFSVVVVIHRLGQRASLKTNTYIKERALSEMINHEKKKLEKLF